MARKKNPYREYGIATQSVHTGTDYDEGTGAVRRPLHMANSYRLPDDLSQVNYSSTDLLMYARNGNPNQHWLEEKIAALHDADDAIVLASGVAALHALFWTLRVGNCRKMILCPEIIQSCISSAISAGTVVISRISPTLAPQKISPFSRSPFTALTRAWVIQ